ncbi:hypothetical protein D3C75_918820 [compost metagenome]
MQDYRLAVFFRPVDKLLTGSQNCGWITFDLNLGHCLQVELDALPGEHRLRRDDIKAHQHHGDGFIVLEAGDDECPSTLHHSFSTEAVYNHRLIGRNLFIRIHDTEQSQQDNNNNCRDCIKNNHSVRHSLLFIIVRFLSRRELLPPFLYPPSK